MALAASLAVGVVAFNVILSSRLSSDATDAARARASARLATLQVTKGRLSVGEAPDAAVIDTQVWVFAADGRALEAPEAASPTLNALASSLTGAPGRVREGPGDVRMVSLAVAAGGERLGTVVAGVSLRPYARTRWAALVGSVALAGLLFAVATGATAWSLRAALRPVSRMTRDADAWSERDLTRRFGQGDANDELSALARTLDGLLDRISASLQRERRFTAEISHELRTPLARIVAEGEFTLRRERDATRYRDVVARLVGHARELDRILDTLLETARADAAAVRGECAVALGVQRAVDACAALIESRGITVGLPDANDTTRVGVDTAHLARIVQPVLENACHYARSSVDVAWAASGRTVEVCVRDDGPGVGTEEAERIFEPGVRGVAASRSGIVGSGLGLPLARRLAATAGGDIVANPEDAGGRFTIRLPVATHRDADT
ncbi:MAG: HAMP domain-containing histidine kinase [Actinobacteria bacterium]|nr:HAMP domain-containing histidine kinase [Actinomycetota bacterium]